MKILCAGASGFIGQPLMRALAGAGHEITATVHSKEPPAIEGVKRIEADLTVRGCWNLALHHRPEVVYMVAGKTGGSGLDPLHFVTDNALMALNMFRSCAEFGVKRIVAMSSTTGYPTAGFRPLREEEYFDDIPPPAYFNPGHTRRFIERLAEMYPAIETVFVRCAGAFGPGDDFDPQSSHAIAATVRKVAERQDPIRIWGDGLAVRDGTYIDDLIRALVLLMDAPAGAYNVGHGRGMSIRDIASTLCRFAGYAPRFEYDTSKPQMIAARILDCRKMNALGWMPLVGMEDGLRMTLDAYERR